MTSNYEDFEREEIIVLRSILFSELWIECRKELDHRVLEICTRATRETHPGNVAIIMGECDATLRIWERTVDRFVSLKTGKAHP